MGNGCLDFIKSEAIIDQKGSETLSVSPTKYLENRREILFTVQLILSLS